MTFNLGVSSEVFYFSKGEIDSKGAERNGLYSFNEESKKLVLIRYFEGNVVRFMLAPGAVVFVEQQGFRKTVNYYNIKSKILLTSELPDFVSFAYPISTNDSKLLLLKLNSDLNSKRVPWNLETNTILFGENFEKEMLESPEFSVSVSFKLVPSFDGTLVPIRMLSKKGVALENVPVYMEVYGGFGAQQSLLPRNNPIVHEFIKRGGLYIGTGVRGGNEFGERWHKAAILEKKHKTFEDLAAIAKSLIETGVSVREKIAIRGRSNGGLVTAATALFYPQYFGLAIAENGVLDMLAKERLDTRFNEGWSDEYGDSRRPVDFEFLSKFSPLENIAKAIDGSSFLIVNGRKDSRVSPAHSFKFAMAASDIRSAGRKIDVETISLNNTGHHASDSDGDYIGLRAQLIIWTRIYDQMGMQF